MNNSLMFSSKDQTWETPIDLFNRLNNIFKFNTDVCALPQTAKCNHYFTPEINGLEQEWTGSCWMNPPYGREQIIWVQYAYYQSMRNRSTIVCLIPARPDTKIWQDLIFKSAIAVCFIKGRIKFGEGSNAAPFPSALVVFGPYLTLEQELLLNELGKTFILPYDQNLPVWYI